MEKRGRQKGGERVERERDSGGRKRRVRGEVDGVMEEDGRPGLRT